MKYGTNTKGTIYHQSVVNKIYSPEEALNFLPDEKTSVGIVLLLPQVNSDTGNAEFITISEWNEYKPDTLVTKFPSCTMDKAKDQNIFAAAIREAKDETGYAISELEVIFAADVSDSSGNKGLRHLKAFVMAKKISKMGPHTEAGIVSVDWRIADKTIENYIVKGQKIALHPIFKKLQTLGLDYARATMNMHRIFPEPVEGVYEVNKREVWTKRK